LSEQDLDPAGYLNDVNITTRETFLNDFASLMEGSRYLQLEKETYHSYRKTHMTQIMEAALEDLFTVPCRREDIL
jgi:hypothetical protein